MKVSEIKVKVGLSREEVLLIGIKQLIEHDFSSFLKKEDSDNLRIKKIKQMINEYEESKLSIK